MNNLRVLRHEDEIPEQYKPVFEGEHYKYAFGSDIFGDEESIGIFKCSRLAGGQIVAERVSLSDIVDSDNRIYLITSKYLLEDDEKLSEIALNELEKYTEEQETTRYLSSLPSSDHPYTHYTRLIDYLCKYDYDLPVTKNSSKSRRSKNSRFAKSCDLRTGPKVQRNELCPCDSGLKYKKCCGK